jgi:membrane-associated protein
MLRNVSALQKNTLRFLAWGCGIAVLWAIWQDRAFAQGTGVVEPEADFLGDVFHSIFLFDTERLMRTLQKPEFAIPAFLVLNLIIFTETGLLIGFFLPGDSLLVITGMICARDDCAWSMPLLLAALSISAIVGDTVGYWIGSTTGPKIFSREKSFFFAKDHLLKAQAFYEKHGGVTIILARFVPFLRTFAPVVAGVGKMQYRQFLSFNICGGIGWIFSMVFAGYFLPKLLNPLLEPVFGQNFQVQRHIEKVVIIVVLLSVLPIVFGWLKGRMAGKSPGSNGAESKQPALSGK